MSNDAMTATRARIGSVELLRLRVYPFNPDDPLGFDHTGADVVVEPGVYPLFRASDGSRYWVMEGRISDGGFRKLGDGLFSMGPDNPTGPVVSHASKLFDEAAWADLLDEDTCAEGHRDQRLRILVDGER